MSSENYTNIIWEDFKKALIFPEKLYLSTHSSKNSSEAQSDVYLTIDASYFFNEESLVTSKINYKFIQIMPTILTGLGPFFTFLKMAIAFTAINFSADVNVADTLNSLIGNIQIAALCSVFAVGLSLLFMFIEKIMYNGMCKKHYINIQKEFVRLFDVVTSEKFLIDLVKESKIQNNNNEKLLKTMPDDFAKAVASFISETKTPFLENILYSLNKLNESFNKGNGGDVYMYIKKQSNNDNNENNIFWVTMTDLMTALVLVFIVLFFYTYMVSYNDKIEQVQEQQKVAKELKETLQEKKIDAQIDSISGIVKISDLELFDLNSYELSQKGKDYLSKFAPAYLDSIFTNEYLNENIDKIVIQGHTDSQTFAGQFSADEQYMKNMELSLKRAYEVANYMTNTPYNKANGNRLRKMIVVEGASFSNPVLTKGKEDYAKSRRVELKIVMKEKSSFRNMLNKSDTDVQ